MIEMIVAIAISSAIGGGVLLSIYQVTSYQAMDKARMTCVKQVENAIHYIVRDVQMAQKVGPADPDPDGFPLVLTWTEWDETSSEYENTVTYTLIGSGPKQLERQHLAYDTQGNETKNVTNVVARYIDGDSDKTNCDYAGGVLSLELTAAITGFPKVISETRTIGITTRPDW